ncbi:NAD-dependent epimerase/dehydratase family protein [Pseudodesulfovibrio tunisiensis]|uniref:NAD-dependent epimerase/dehydratase family protein n=1 Tax=Pseudodesulfovibrio tunisiensis TaxID=463192 RepID=UPI001FB4B9A5|nr:NAD-dependent epimerase/dehydratase family protein [Pseudodesulfovibrio tunisiensis]
MPERTCLVTGCAGFVGSHLAERLLALGHVVVGVDNFFSGRRRNMASFAGNPDFHFHECSITEPDLLPRLRDEHPNLSQVYHLAAIVSVPYSMEHEQETMTVNWEATRTLHDQARELDFGKFVFAGSAAEYGDATALPLKEEHATDETRQLSPYGRAKFLSSRHIAEGGFGASLRCFNIFGPRQDPSSPYSGVVSIFMNRSIAHQPILIYGDGTQTRDFVYVSDVVNAYLLAAGITGEGQLSGIYNVARGEETSIVGIAMQARAIAGSTAPIDFTLPRPGDIHRSLADISRLRAHGYAPQVEINHGLRQTMAELQREAEEK